MSQMKLRGIDKEPKKKIRRKSKKKVSPGNSLRKLAGGWSRKEADEFLESLEPFDQVSKTAQK
jgi:hypothetical protein